MTFPGLTHKASLLVSRPYHLCAKPGLRPNFARHALAYRHGLLGIAINAASSRSARLARGLRATLLMAQIAAPSQRRAAAALPVLCRDLVDRQRPVSRSAGARSRSSHRLTVRGSAFRSPTTPAPASCRCRRSPIRRRSLRARAAVRYDDVARALVHAFKYGDRLDSRPLLGGWMARAGAKLLDGADALVPVPLHWRRLWTRRFNQSAALAAGDLASLRRPAGRAWRAAPGQGRHSSRSGCRCNETCRQRPGRVPRRTRREGRDRWDAGSS